MTCRERERKREREGGRKKRGGRPTGGNPWGLLQGWNQIHRVSKNEMPPYPTIAFQPPFLRGDYGELRKKEREES